MFHNLAVNSNRIWVFRGLTLTVQMVCVYMSKMKQGCL